MKKRTKAENAAYSRALRARRRGDVAPTVAPASDHCANCAPLAAEVWRLRDRIEMLEAQLVKGDTPTPTPKAEDADALRQRVIAVKVDRINTFGRNPSIGTARL